MDWFLYNKDSCHERVEVCQYPKYTSRTCSKLDTEHKISVLTIIKVNNKDTSDDKNEFNWRRSGVILNLITN